MPKIEMLDSSRLKLDVPGFNKAQLICESCGGAKNRKDFKYCKKCSKDQLSLMEQEGYLTPTKSPFYRRPKSARENIWETKYGIDY